MKLAAIDRDALVPLYHQLFATLRDQIIAGAYARDAALPSERELARLYGVSRITAQRAMDELAAAGLARREHGRGTFVAGSVEPGPMDASMQALIDNVVALGGVTTGHVLEAEMALPPTSIRDALKLRPGDVAHHSKHIRMRDGDAFGLIETWVPRDIGARITQADIEAKPMLLLLEDLGARPTWATQAIGAKVASPEEARLLGLSAGAPLVRLQRLVHDATDRAVEHLVALYRGDRYEYRTVLRRDAAGPRVWSVS